MTASRSGSISDSDSTRQPTRAEQDSDAITARGEDGEIGRDDIDLEKGTGTVEKATDGALERTERDADGVAVEDGIPLVNLTGDDDPLS